ncbi:MAG: sporulation protein [Candidatus Sericytochromatia bacterium]
MFDKFLSKVGIGSAKVDTVLHQNQVVRGEFIQGEIRMTGGKSDQEINKVYLELQTRFIEEHDEGSSIHTYTLHRLDIADRFVLAAHEEVIYDFELEVPFVTPVSFGPAETWIRTGLDVSWAFDPKDHDVIVVQPDAATEQVMLAAEQLGFEHTHHSGRSLAMYTHHGVPFVQEFEMRGRGQIGHLIEELEILVQADAQQAHFQLEADRRNRGPLGWMSDAMDMDEHHLRFSLPQSARFGPAELENILRRVVH